MSTRKRKPSAANAALLMNASASMSANASTAAALETIHKNVRNAKLLSNTLKNMHNNTNRRNTAKNGLSNNTMQQLERKRSKMIKYIKILNKINMHLGNSVTEIKKLSTKIIITNKRFKNFEDIKDAVLLISEEMEKMPADIKRNISAEMNRMNVKSLSSENRNKISPILYEMKQLYQEYRRTYQEIDSNLKEIGRHA